MDALITIFDGQVVVAIALGIALLSTFVIAYCIKKQNTLLQQVNKLSEELRIANRGAIGMGQQIITLEKKIQRMSANAQSSVQQHPQQSSLQLSQQPSPQIDSTQAQEDPTNDMSKFTDIVSKEILSEDSTALDASSNNEPEDHENEKLNLARDLLAKGKELTEVASTCQLSFAEVSLLRALNPTSTPPNQPHAH